MIRAAGSPEDDFYDACRKVMAFGVNRPDLDPVAAFGNDSYQLHDLLYPKLARVIVSAGNIGLENLIGKLDPNEIKGIKGDLRTISDFLEKQYGEERDLARDIMSWVNNPHKRPASVDKIQFTEHDPETLMGNASRYALELAGSAKQNPIAQRNLMLAFLVVEKIFQVMDEKGLIPEEDKGILDTMRTDFANMPDLEADVKKWAGELSSKSMGKW